MTGSMLTRGAAVCAALLYFAVAFAWLGDVWERPDELLLIQKGSRLAKSDQLMVLATVTDNSRRALYRPAEFFDSGACHPLPHPASYLILFRRAACHRAGLRCVSAVNR